MENLIAQSNTLEEMASKIQVGDEIGLTQQEIAAFVEQYNEWYTDCLVLLNGDLETKFRAEYEGTWIEPRIRKFLEQPTKVNVLPRDDEKVARVISHWQHPYETAFRAPFRKQRQILLEAKKRGIGVLSKSIPIEQVELLARRFHLFARQLQKRYDNRSTVTIADEYDVQDLFHSLLRLYFDDIRPEETTPSYAGGRPRVDFLLKSEKIVIEIKKTRANLKAKDVRDQLIVDIHSYQAHPDCQLLVAFVYDPECYIDNPRALESDLSAGVNGMQVKVIVVQS